MCSGDVLKMADERKSAVFSVCMCVCAQVKMRRDTGKERKTVERQTSSACSVEQTIKKTKRREEKSCVEDGEGEREKKTKVLSEEKRTKESERERRFTDGDDPMMMMMSAWWW